MSTAEKEIARYTWLTTGEIAQSEGVTAETVLGWIHRCGLRAKNIGTRTRPVYRVRPDWLATFVATRTVNG